GLARLKRDPPTARVDQCKKWYAWPDRRLAQQMRHRPRVSPLIALPELRIDHRQLDVPSRPPRPHLDQLAQSLRVLDRHGRILRHLPLMTRELHPCEFVVGDNDRKFIPTPPAFSAHAIKSADHIVLDIWRVEPDFQIRPRHR